MTLTRRLEVLKRKFNDNGDVKSPLEFPYVQQVTCVLSCIGSWPHGQFGRRRLHAALAAYNLVLVVTAAVLISLQILYIRKKITELTFSDLGHIILCATLEFLYFQRMCVARMNKYHDTIKYYLLEFHLFYFKNKSEYIAKIHSQIHIVSGIFTLLVLFQMAWGPILFTFMPLYNNYSRGMFGQQRPANATFEQAVYYYCFTDEVYTTSRGYWALFAFNVPMTFCTTIGICTFDLLLSLIVLQIWGHLKILKYDISNIPLPRNTSKNMYSAQENVTVRRLLKEIVVYHNFIIKFVDRCSDTFSEYLFAFYFVMQIITCILLVQVNTFTADSLAKYGILTVVMHQQLIQVSILFETLNTKSEELCGAVYAMPWECMDARNRRSALLLLRRVQTPVSLRAAKLVPVGVSTMSTVLRTSISYYLTLNAVER